MASDAKGVIKLALLLALLTLVLAFCKFFYSYILRPRWYARHVPGPKHHSWTYGHMRLLAQKSPAAMHMQFYKEYGPVVHLHGFLGQSSLSILDKVALHHVIVSYPYSFPKPPLYRRSFGQVLGHSLLTVEGADHQRQRKILNASFGAPHMKSLYPLFLAKAIELRDTILNSVSRTGSATLDIADYANRTTLDVISSAGFGYEANAIELGRGSELFDSFNRVFGTHDQQTLYEVFTRFFPSLDILPGGSARKNAAVRARAVLTDIAVRMVQEKKAAVLGDLNSEEPVDASQMAGRDILSVLVKANMAVGLRPHQKMTDEEVVAQISTLLLAGNDTTANAVTWAIYGLCKHPETQNKLREEISSIPTELPTLDVLNSLPYLDAVIRETLRVFSPVPASVRVASKDCTIPLGTPFTDSNGVVHDSLFVAKNTLIHIPILSIQKNVDTWGPDAEEFNPSRWTDRKLPDGVLEMPSIAFPTFVAGPRGCIGFRFSLYELKAVLFSLVRVMRFELTVPADDIIAKAYVVTRPKVKSRPNEGWQLPVRVIPIDPSV